MAVSTGYIWVFPLSSVEATYETPARSGTGLPITIVSGTRSFGGGTTIQVLNRVYDSVAGNFVRWATDSPDPSGASYPGPGTFGPDTSDYVVEDQSFS